MLYAEVVGGNLASPHDNTYTIVRFNERAHTSIRRFVVVQVKRGFVKAWQVNCILPWYQTNMKLSGIGTYSGKGVLKHGCMPAEHAIVYLSGTDPASCYLPGEYGSGMTKMPIEIVPVDSSITLRRESRVRFGKTYPIEMNVKVKDIGRVEASQLGRLLRYWESEEGLFHVDSENFADEPRHGVLESKSTPDPDSDGEDVVLLKMDARYDLSADHMHSRLAGNLSSGLYCLSFGGYQLLTICRVSGYPKPKRFFQERHRIHGTLARAWRRLRQGSRGSARCCEDQKICRD